MVGGESVANEGAGSIRQHDEDDAVDLVGQGRTESGNTGQVDGAFCLRQGTGGTGEGRRAGGWRSGNGCRSEELTASAAGATGGSGATLNLRERMREGESEEGAS